MAITIGSLANENIPTGLIEVELLIRADVIVGLGGIATYVHVGERDLWSDLKLAANYLWAGITVDRVVKGFTRCPDENTFNDLQDLKKLKDFGVFYSLFIPQTKADTE